MSTTFDPVTNLAYAVLDGGITSVATTFNVVSGGSLFPNPAIDGSFDVTIWNITDYNAAHLDPNVEIMRVTTRSTNAFTVTRAQQSTSGVAHNSTGKTYAIALTFTKKGYDEITAAINLRGELAGTQSWTGVNSFDQIRARTSGGVVIEASNGTDVALFGAGGGAGATFYGGVNIGGDVAFSSSLTSVATNTSDASDNKAITIAGGGAYGIIRGSGIAVIGNEYATIGGDLELMAGDSATSGAIKHYVGNGAGGAYLAVKTERTTGLTTFYGGIDVAALTQLRYAVTIGGLATSDSVGLEIGNTAGGTPYIDFKSSAVDYDVRIINGASNTLSFLGASAGYFFDTTINSIYSIVGTTSNATLTTITQGITIAGNLVTSAYVADGYTAGLTWASTDDNASKPKGGIFLKTTSAGSYIFFGTSNAYAAGIVNTVSIDPDGIVASAGFSTSTTTTTGTALSITGSSLTTGKLGYFYSNSSDTSTRRLVDIHNDNASATGTTALVVTNDSTGNIASFLGGTSTGNGMLLATSSLTTGRALYVYSDSGNSSTRNLVELYNDNVLATGTTLLYLKNDSTGNAITSEGKIQIGTTAPYFSAGSALTINTSVTTGAAGSGSLMIQGDANKERIVMVSSGNPVINMFACRGTIASPTATQNGDLLSGVSGGGYGATGWSGNKYVFLQYATENWTDSAQGLYTAFYSVPNGSTSLTARLLINQDGAITLGSVFSTGTGALYAGAGTFTGLLTTVASATGSAGLRIPHGTAPSSPVNGDIWTTTAGAFIRINGVTKSINLT